MRRLSIGIAVGAMPARCLLLVVALTGAACARGPCPRDMAPIPGRAACIDRYEASLAGESAAARAVSRQGALPAVNVTLAHAREACTRAGKRLCLRDEWLTACAGADGAREFPYGPRFEPGRCEDWEHAKRRQARGPARTGAHPGCRTPEGVHDLSGNAWEHVETGGADGEVRGGGFGNAFRDAACKSREAHVPPTYNSPGIGFRCCADQRGGAPASQYSQ
jgi:formylglycine-generating enzyme required for sulfatase activity